MSHLKTAYMIGAIAAKEQFEQYIKQATTTKVGVKSTAFLSELGQYLNKTPALKHTLIGGGVGALGGGVAGSTVRNEPVKDMWGRPQNTGFSIGNTALGTLLGGAGGALGGRNFNKLREFTQKLRLPADSAIIDWNRGLPKSIPEGTEAEVKRIMKTLEGT